MRKSSTNFIVKVRNTNYHNCYVTSLHSFRIKLNLQFVEPFAIFNGHSTFNNFECFH